MSSSKPPVSPETRAMRRRNNRLVAVLLGAVAVILYLAIGLRWSSH